jgi:hypothetical protein
MQQPAIYQTELTIEQRNQVRQHIRIMLGIATELMTTMAQRGVRSKETATGIIFTPSEILGQCVNKIAAFHSAPTLTWGDYEMICGEMDYIRNRYTQQFFPVASDLLERMQTTSWTPLDDEAERQRIRERLKAWGEKHFSVNKEPVFQEAV